MRVDKHLKLRADYAVGCPSLKDFDMPECVSYTVMKVMASIIPELRSQVDWAGVIAEFERSTRTEDRIEQE